MAQTGNIGGLYVTDDYIEVVYGAADVRKIDVRYGLFPCKAVGATRLYFRDFKPSVYGTKRVEATFQSAADWILERSGVVEKIGVGCFGPFECLDHKKLDKAKYGRSISSIRNRLNGKSVFNLVESAFVNSQAVAPDIRIQTDVDVAALGELYSRYVSVDRWINDGSNQVVAFLKFSSGVGGGVVHGDKLWGGRLHPEMGHIRVERWRPLDDQQKKIEDDFEGVCEHHGSCLEGLASAQAFKKRWGTSYRNISDPSHPAWDRQAHYAAQLCIAVTCLFVPSRIVIGGGMMQSAKTIDATIGQFRHLIGAKKSEPYPPYPELLDDSFIDGYSQPRDQLGCGARGSLILAALQYSRPAELHQFL